MELRNPLTKSRADELYFSKDFTRNDGLDNTTDYFILGASASYQAFNIDYAIVLPVSDKTQTGTLAVSHVGGIATVNRHAYDYAVPEISGLSFGADINGGNVRLSFTKAAVGENPTFFYRITKHDAV